MTDSSKPKRPRRGAPPHRKRVPPPDATGRERAWFQERVDAEASISVLLHDGERIEGRVEAFDGAMLVVRPPGASPVHLRTSDVRYIVGLDDT